MLSELITSKTRTKLLTEFLTHPEERFYFKNLVERLSLPPSVVQSELKRFSRIGLLNSEKQARSRFYWVNKNFLLYPELKSIVLKTAGLGDFLRSALTEIGSIEVALVYGSVARNVEDVTSDVDLLVIGDVDMTALHDAVAKAEETIGREINPSIFSAKEWKERAKKKQAFVTDISKNPKILLIGTEDELRRLT